MLIVDMLMPKDGGCHIAVDWDGHSFVCSIKRKTCDYFFSKKRPDWCPIKGVLVRCGECKHRDPEDKRCDCGGHEWVKGKILPVKDDWFCADGERKDGERDV